MPLISLLPTLWGGLQPPPLPWHTPLHNLGEGQTPLRIQIRAEEGGVNDLKTKQAMDEVTLSTCRWCGLTSSQQQGLWKLCSILGRVGNVLLFPSSSSCGKFCQDYHSACQSKHYRSVSYLPALRKAKKILNILALHLVRTQIISVLKFSSPFLGTRSFHASVPKNWTRVVHGFLPRWDTLKSRPS